MEYIVHYDLAAIILTVLVIVLFHAKRYFPSTSNKVFRLMGVSLLISAASDVISVYLIHNASTVPLPLNYIVNIIYFFSFNCTYLIFYLYVAVLTTEGKKLLFHKICCFILMTIIGLFVVTTPLTHFVFYFENGEYLHGPYTNVFYPIAYFILFMTLILTISSRNKLQMIQKVSTYLFVGALLVVLAIQIMNPELLIINFVGSLLYLLIYQSLQNPADYLERDLGVFNQRAFLEMTEVYTKKKKSFTVLAFELEGFQFVDQFMGVENGNDLLKTVTNDCAESLSGNLYHIEGTQFAYIFEQGSPEISQHAEWIKWRFLSAFQVCGVEISLIARICAVNYPEVAENREQLMNAIAFTIQEVKRENTADMVWASKESILERKRDTMITHILNRAVRNQEFEVYYQPIYSTKYHGFHAAEALVRLRDKELGFISPDEFVPLAEKSGLILEIGEIVFRKVCKFIQGGRAATLGIKYIEVNLSVVQCMQENMHKRLTGIMDEYEIPYSMIDFEITETFSSEDNGILIKNMEALIDSGCTFAMDDYGTGFSNTDYLMEFPFKLIKLDKSFVWAAMENEKALKILKHTVAMIKSLDLKIVAEGVETKQQAKILIDMGCDYLQGYYFSPPIPLEKYVIFMQNGDEILDVKLPPERKLSTAKGKKVEKA